MAPSKHVAVQSRHGLNGAFETATVCHTGEAHRGKEPEPGSKLLLQGEKLNLGWQTPPDGAHEVECYKLGLTCWSLLHLVSTQASSTQLHYLRAPEGA